MPLMCFIVYVNLEFLKGAIKEYAFKIEFSTSAAKTEGMKAAILEEVMKLKKEGLFRAWIDKLLANSGQVQPVDLKTSYFWTDYLSKNNNSKEISADRNRDRLKRLSAADIQKAAKRYLPQDKYLMFVLN